LIVKKERDGDYYILSERKQESPSWFVSDTKILNAVDKPLGLITWDTEGFLRFASTISNTTASTTADEGFQTILWACAQSGLNLLDERTVEAVFGRVIDQELLSFNEQKEFYVEHLGPAYGISPEAIIAQVRPSNKYWAMNQLNAELARKAEERRIIAEAASEAAIRRATFAEKELAKVEKFRGLMEAKKKKGLKIAKKQKAKSAKKKKKRR
jgi:hypothetical protein